MKMLHSVASWLSNCEKAKPGKSVCCFFPLGSFRLAGLLTRLLLFLLLLLPCVKRLRERGSAPCGLITSLLRLPGDTPSQVFCQTVW